MALTLVTLVSERHKLVHVALYGTMEGPSPKKKQIFHLHFGCGAKSPRGEFERLGERTRRVPTCLGCARWSYRKGY